MVSKQRSDSPDQEDWQDINLKEQAKLVRRDPSLKVPDNFESVALLLRYVYVTSQERFVDMADLKIQRKEGAFDENYQSLKLPTRTARRRRRRQEEGDVWETYQQRIKPSEYLREYHSETRVVDRMAPLIKERAQIVRDERGWNVFNTYKHPPTPPPEYEPKEPRPFIEFLHWLLNGDDDHFQHVTKWMAHVVFREAVRMNHGILISGGQNIGKGTFGLLMRSLVGEGGKTITPKELKGDFNPWVLETQLCVIDEIKEAGNYDLYNSIKVNFTEDTVYVNPKYVNPYPIENHVNYLMFSKFSIPLNVEQDDRRIYYVDSNVTAKDEVYYVDLKRYLEAEGLWDVWYYLRDEVLPTVSENFNFAPPPKTADHQELTRGGLHPVEEYLQEKLYEEETLFRPEVFFEKSALLEHLREQMHLRGSLRNTTEVNGILRKLGLVSKRKTINQRKGTFSWFDRNNWGSQMDVLFDIKDPEARRTELAPFYAGTSLTKWGFK